VRRAVAWPLAGPPVLVLVTFGVIAARLAPPAPDVALWCFGAASALLALKLLIWTASSYRAFDRPERLAAFVMACAIGMGWYSVRQWVHERQFDDLVAAQNADLQLTVDELSAEILSFLAERGRQAPPPPRAATWDQDETEITRYEIATVQQFDARFEKQVRATHDILSLLGLRDRDLDLFYAHPASPFQMQVIAMKLAKLGARIDARR
jgi:hypothetical protein